MMSKDSIDDRLYNLIMSKRSLASKITGSTDAAFENESSFKEIMSLVITDNNQNE